MKLKATTTSCSLLVTATFLIISGGLAEIICPKIVAIEEGRTEHVSCDSTEKKIELVFWYIGDPAISSPILRLEDGKPGGTEYGKGHYSITSSGGMIILNATIEHQRVYTLLVYFQDGTRNSTDIMVNVTISPWHPCPVINGCIPCEECRLNVNDTGKLTCSVTEARPMIPLKWTIETQKGVRILEHPRIAVNDITSDSWNSSVEVSYEVSSCNQEATLQCLAKDTFRLLKLPQASIRIYTANCTNSTSHYTPAQSRNAVIIVAVFCVSMVVISSMFLLTYVYFNRRRKSKLAKDSETNFLGEVPPTSPSKIRDADAQKLTSRLKEKYRTSRLFDSLPNEKETMAADLFAICNFKFKHANGEMAVLPGNKLFKYNGIRNESRVFVIGGPRFWKTMFTKQFVQQWIDEKKNDFILLYLRKSELKAHVNLVDLLAQETSLDQSLIAKSMKSSKCILIIDGLDSIVFDKNETKNEQREPSYKNDMTISKDELLAHITSSDLLKTPQDQIYSHIHILVTTWYKNANDDIFTSPYAEIYISDVTDEQQFNELIEKLYKQYSCSSKLLLSEEHDTGVNTKSITYTVSSKKEQSTVNFKGDDDPITLDSEIPDEQSCSEKEEAEKLLCDEKKTEEINQHEIDDDVRQHVNVFLKKNRIYQQFKKTPFVLSLMVLIKIQNHFQQRADFDQAEITTTEQLICEVVRYLQEAYFVIHGQEVFLETCDVEATLGRVSLHHISETNVRVNKQNPVPQIAMEKDCGDDINLAIEMGLIQFKESKEDSQPDEKNTESFSLHSLEFVHQHIMYYFAAIHMVKNKEFYTVLAEYEENQSRSILKFLIHLEKSSLNDLVGALLQLKMGDDVIDCLSKWKNPNDVDEMLASLQDTEIQVSSLDGQNHCIAFKSFLRKCIDKQIKLESLVIRGNVPAPVLTSLELPIINKLTLSDREVQEMEFVSILRWLSKKEITLRFQNCKIQEELSDDVKKAMKSFEGTKVKTIRQRDESDCSSLSFNYKAATWKNNEEPMAKTIKHNLPTRANLKKVFAALN